MTVVVVGGMILLLIVAVEVLGTPRQPPPDP